MSEEFKKTTRRYDEIHLDKNGQQVGYDIDGDSITAYRISTGKKIGRLEIDMEKGDGGEMPRGNWLNEIGVYDNEKRKGIGAKMLELAVQHLEFDSIPCVRAGLTQTYPHLTSEGEVLVASCVRKKIIPEKYCKFPGDYQRCDLVIEALNAISTAVAANKDGGSKPLSITGVRGSRSRGISAELRVSEAKKAGFFGASKKRKRGQGASDSDDQRPVKNRRTDKEDSDGHETGASAFFIST